MAGAAGNKSSRVITSPVTRPGLPRFTLAASGRETTCSEVKTDQRRKQVLYSKRFSLGTRRLNLVAALTASTLVILGGAFAAGLASAADDEPTDPNNPSLPDEPGTHIQCSGKVTKSSDDELPFNYAIKCSNKELLGYSIISNREIDATTTEPVGLEPGGEVAEGEDFFCKSSIPGWGIACYGKGGTVTLGVGNTIRAGISTFDPICDADVQPKFWMVPVYTYQEDKFGSIKEWTTAGDPILLNSRAVRCKMLNPKKVARKACKQAKRAEGKAKKKAKAECRKARAEVKRTR